MPIKSALPTVTTSLHPGNIGGLCFLLGKDIGIFVGGAVVGHPNGLEAGAKLVRKSIEEATKENYDASEWLTGEEKKFLDKLGWRHVKRADLENPRVLAMSRLFRALYPCTLNETFT